MRRLLGTLVMWTAAVMMIAALTLAIGPYVSVMHLPIGPYWLIYTPN